MAGALHDAKQRLERVASGPKGAFGPTMRERHGHLCLSVRSGGWDALVESHHDVTADHLLHRDAGFRREEVRFSIHITLKTGAVFVHFSGVRQRKYLKAAGVGQHRAIPVHETVDAAELLK